MSDHPPLAGTGRPRRLVMLYIGLAWNILGAAESSSDADEQRYLTLLRAGTCAAAASLAAAHTVSDPAASRWWAYLGVAQALQDDHRGAADAFCRAECLGGPTALDRKMLFLRVQALGGVRANTRADRVLTHLSQRYPFSRLAGPDETLSQVIRKRLGEGVSTANLNWCRLAALEATREQRGGLAIEYGEEFIALATIAGLRSEADDPDIRLALGVEYLQLGAHTAARDHFLRVEPAYHGWRAAVFQALALRACGDETLAQSLLKQALAGTSDPQVKDQAQSLLSITERQ